MLWWAVLLLLPISEFRADDAECTIIYNNMHSPCGVWSGCGARIVFGMLFQAVVFKNRIFYSVFRVIIYINNLRNYARIYVLLLCNIRRLLGIYYSMHTVYSYYLYYLFTHFYTSSYILEDTTRRRRANIVGSIHDDHRGYSKNVSV